MILRLLKSCLKAFEQPATPVELSATQPVVTCHDCLRAQYLMLVELTSCCDNGGWEPNQVKSMIIYKQQAILDKLL